MIPPAVRKHNGVKLGLHWLAAILRGADYTAKWTI